MEGYEGIHYGSSLLEFEGSVLERTFMFLGTVFLEI